MPKRQKFRIPFYLATHGHRNPYALEQLRGAEIDFAVLPTLNHVKWKTNNKNGLEKSIFSVTCLCVNQKKHTRARKHCTRKAKENILDSGRSATSTGTLAKVGSIVWIRALLAKLFKISLPEFCLEAWVSKYGNPA